MRSTFGGGIDLGSPYQGYMYAYPHKTAYRPLRPRPSLRDVWAGEDTRALFCYVHIPFCDMRCGFCNLFTRSNPPAAQVRAFLRQLRAQAARVRAALPPPARFARVAIGGGTPTYLEAAELSALFDLLATVLGVDVLPTAVETSPSTATADRLTVLAERGVTRISVGVQSFLDDEAHRAGRPQRRAAVDRALTLIRSSGIPTMNLDLIYGIPGQTAATWATSLETALSWEPEELYLYPLYVRPLTGIGRRAVGRVAAGAPDPRWDAQRMTLYLRAVDRLTAAGYRQESMRMFRRIDAPEVAGPVYCCQDDGMVGLGCGARSYTTALHYSFDYAVSVNEVRAIIDDYVRRPAADFDHAEVGFALDAAERRRRWLLKSLLRARGLDRDAYLARFGATVDDDFPLLSRLGEAGYLAADAERVWLTAEGLAMSDAIGPFLVSTPVRRAMAGYAAR